MLKTVLRVVFLTVAMGLMALTGAQAAKVQGMQITPEIKASVDRLNS